MLTLLSLFFGKNALPALGINKRQERSISLVLLLPKKDSLEKNPHPPIEKRLVNFICFYNGGTFCSWVHFATEICFLCITRTLYCSDECNSSVYINVNGSVLIVDACTVTANFFSVAFCCSCFCTPAFIIFSTLCPGSTTCNPSIMASCAT